MNIYKLKMHFLNLIYKVRLSLGSCSELYRFNKFPQTFEIKNCIFCITSKSELYK